MWSLVAVDKVVARFCALASSPRASYDICDNVAHDRDNPRRGKDDTLAYTYSHTLTDAYTR